MTEPARDVVERLAHESYEEVGRLGNFETEWEFDRTKFARSLLLWAAEVVREQPDVGGKAAARTMRENCAKALEAKAGELK